MLGTLSLFVCNLTGYGNNENRKTCFRIKTKIGYEEYEIKLNNYFNSMESKVDTPYGFITLSSSKDSKSTAFKIKTINKEGILLIPESMGSEITITGDSYEKLENNNGYYAFKLKGEKYNIQII